MNCSYERYCLCSGFVGLIVPVQTKHINIGNLIISIQVNDECKFFMNTVVCIVYCNINEATSHIFMYNEIQIYIY
jgi:hypothetical protein